MRQMWDERYSEPGYAYGTGPNDFLVSVADRIPNGPVLCLAEGQGRNAVYLAQLGHRVVAVDQSAIGLAKAAELARSRGVHLETVEADLATYPVQPGSWAAVILIFVHLPAPLRKQVHARAVQGLRPGGALILEAYAPAQLGRGTGGPPDREFLIGLDDLQEELTGLDLEIARELERDLHEGRYHNGRSAVVQALGFQPSSPPPRRQT